MEINDKIVIYNKDKLLDIISCPICLEPYKHPRNLDCGHSYCTTCLHLIKINNEIICPLCRKSTYFNENKLLIDLPVNNVLISIIDESKQSKQSIEPNKKIRKYKSVDSFIEYKQKQNKRSVYYDKIINTTTENNDTDLRECCSFQ